MIAVHLHEFARVELQVRGSFFMGLFRNDRLKHHIVPCMASESASTVNEILALGLRLLIIRQARCIQRVEVLHDRGLLHHDILVVLALLPAFTRSVSAATGLAPQELGQVG